MRAMLGIIVAATILVGSLPMLPAIRSPDRVIFFPTSSATLTDALAAGMQVIATYDGFVVADASSTSWLDAHHAVYHALTTTTGRGNFIGDPLVTSLVPVDWRNDLTQLQLVQFIGPVKPEWRAAVENANFRVVADLPPMSLVARPTGTLSAVPTSLPGIRWTGPYHPGFKVEASLIAATSDIAVLVVAGADTTLSQLQTSATLAGCPPTTSWLDRTGPRVLCQSSPSSRRALAFSDNVLWIEPSRGTTTLSMNNARSILQSGVPAEAAAHAAGLRGEGQLVTVIDTGIRMGAQNHPRHAGLDDPVTDISFNAGIGSHRKIAAYLNPTLGELTWGDQDDTNPNARGHGTVMTSILVGDALTSAIGTAEGFDGILPAGRVIVVDTGGSGGDPLSLPYDYGLLLRPGYDLGSRVFSASWGTSDRLAQPYNDWSRQLDEFVFSHPDAVILFAAGNRGTQALTQEGTAKNIITIGATENLNGGVPSASQNNLWPSSSRGPTMDGRLKPDLLAPGAPIVAADPPTSDGYLAGSGTSQATALASGAAALVRQYFIEGRYPSGIPSSSAIAPSSALVRAVLLAGAVPLTGAESMVGVLGWPNGNQGWGRIQLDSALALQGPSKLSAFDIPPRSVGQPWSTVVNVVDTNQPLAIVGTWVDCPGVSGLPAAICSPQILIVTDPNGVTYVGNNFSPSGPQSLPGGAPNIRDVVQQVRIPSPTIGSWTVMIVPEGAIGNTGLAIRGGTG